MSFVLGKSLLKRLFIASSENHSKSLTFRKRNLQDLNGSRAVESRCIISQLHTRLDSPLDVYQSFLPRHQSDRGPMPPLNAPLEHCFFSSLYAPAAARIVCSSVKAMHTRIRTRGGNTWREHGSSKYRVRPLLVISFNVHFKPPRKHRYYTFIA